MANKWMEYELEKQRILKISKSSEEYENRMKELTERLKL